MAEGGFKPPDTLIFSGSPNLSECWRRWEQRFDLYLKASSKSKEDEKTQVAILLHSLGDEGIEIYNNFIFDDPANKDKIKEVLSKFRDYCNPRKNTVIERYKFWETKQREGETVDHFFTELKTKAKNCEYGDQTNLMIRDRVIFGIWDERLKERMLRESENPTLENVINMCRAAEASKNQLKTLKGEQAEVHVVRKKQQFVPKNAGQVNKRPESHDQAPKYPYRNMKKKQPKTYKCQKCGTTHAQYSCPAFGKKCQKCKKYNHYTERCYYAKRNVGVHEMESLQIDRSSDEDDNLYVGEIKVDAVNKNNNNESWHSLVKIFDKTVKFKLDTGADANVIPANLFYKLPGEMKQTRVKLSSYGDHEIVPLGKTTITCAVNGKTKDLDFYVVNMKSTPLLGLKACQQLELIAKLDSVSENETTGLTKQQLLAENAEVFKGLGKFEKKYNISIDNSIPAVVNPPRRVPLTLMPKLKTKLEKLEKSGVIVKVDGPSEWVNNLVIVEKSNGDLRLCLDPKDLNKAIKREHYNIPTVSEVVANLNGKSIFTIIDEKDGYHQIQLDEESSMLCTFNTPLGRYRYTRLPFGISSASEVFQKRNQQTFGDIEGIQIISDDMIIAGKNEHEHDLTLQKVMKRAKEKNVKFNKEKIQFKVNKVKYMGCEISADGMKPDPDKVKAIQEMPPPEDKKGIERILGTVNYLAPFIPNMSEITAPLRMLLKKDTLFEWTHQQKEAMDKIRSVLINNPVLKFYDVEKDVTIQCDSSQNGIGACLIQEGHPIAYASRALNNAEKHYAQIEKELLSASYAVDRFSQYIYGKAVLIQTDHKPLVAIQNKPLHKAPPRLQRLLLKLQPYNVTLTFLPGKEMLIADTLSRAFLNETEPEDSDLQKEMNVKVHTVIENLPVSEQKLSEYRESTSKDTELQAVIKTINEGWPHHKKNCDEATKKYWNVRNELHYSEGILCVSDRLVVPKDQRKNALEKIHESHLGMDKCKSRARTSLYWPYMNADIEQTCSSCCICNKYKVSNQKEPLIPHEVPKRAWEKVGMDIFEYKAKDYLLVVDYYSKFIEIRHLHGKTAQSIISNVKKIFGVHGIVDEIVSDNMPFNSAQFREFTRKYDIKLSTSSPTYSQSNGLAERSIQTVKNLLKKANDDGKDEFIALLEYRNTPITGSNYSPAQLLMNRMLRDHIPTKAKLLQPQIPVNAKQQLQNKQQQQKRYYDRNAKDLKKLKPNDVIRYRKDEQWKPATIVKRQEAPRSYYIQNDTGVTLRRNRRHLMKTNEQPPPRRDDYDTYEPVNLPQPNNAILEQPGEAAVAPPPMPPRPPTPPRPARVKVAPARYRDPSFVYK
ncbi:MAG: RNase H-like domain-containing protein, partial [Sedimenticola sp.]